GVKEPAQPQVREIGQPEILQGMAVAPKSVEERAKPQDHEGSQRKSGQNDDVILQRTEPIQQRQRREQDQGQARDEIEVTPGRQVGEEAQLLAPPQFAAGEDATPVQFEDLGVAKRPAPTLLFQTPQVVGQDAVTDDLVDVNAF